MALGGDGELAHVVQGFSVQAQWQKTVEDVVLHSVPDYICVGSLTLENNMP